MRLRRFGAALALTVLPALQGGAAERTGAPLQIGPWTVQAWNAGGAFSHCTLHRLENGFVAAFSRSPAGYSLALGSIRWHLQDKAVFAVLLVAGPAQVQAEALATSRNTVSVSLQRNPALVPRIVNEFKAADALEVRIDGDAFRIPSDGAGAALAELDRCWREHQRSADPVGSTPRTASPP